MRFVVKFFTCRKPWACVIWIACSTISWFGTPWDALELKMEIEEKNFPSLKTKVDCSTVLSNWSNCLIKESKPKRIPKKSALDTRCLVLALSDGKETLSFLLYRKATVLELKRFKNLIFSSENFQTFSLWLRKCLGAQAAAKGADWCVVQPHFSDMFFVVGLVLEHRSMLMPGIMPSLKV